MTTILRKAVICLSLFICVTHSPLMHNRHNEKIFWEVDIMTDVQKNFGNRIKELRLKKNLSQEKLALKIYIDRTYLASVENGKRNISINNIYKLAKGLDVTVSELFKGID